jgi:siroheme synthase-like protein
LSGYPIVLDAHQLRALVVGGGSVAARKLSALLDAGAHVRVVAPQLSPKANALVVAHGVEWIKSEYLREVIRDANIVFAATSSAAVNAAIASDAKELGRFVNVASHSAMGDFVTPAVHRSGDTLIAVFAGGVPAAAARIRDHVGAILDPHVSAAIERLARMRSDKLARGEAAQWREASRELVAEDFLASVGNGEFERRVQRWL